MKQIIFLTLLFLSSIFCMAQDKIPIKDSDYANDQVEMADQFRADGKIYVLTGVIALILGGIIVYLVIIDKKVSRLEKQLPKSNIQKPF